MNYKLYIKAILLHSFDIANTWLLCLKCEDKINSRHLKWHVDDFYEALNADYTKHVITKRYK